MNPRAMVTDVIATVKERGLRQAFRIHGWKFVALVVAYYLVRDTLIYLILPFAIVKFWGGT